MSGPQPTRGSSYDEVPYAFGPFHQSHPDVLATVATLLGLSPPPVEGCRVLELGCAAGGNLIPMALSMPAARLLGIDLSARQVAEGRALVEALGLANVELRPMSILEVDDDLGRFDYIICHGVYSWVPAEVRAKILAICARNLAPDGVAYVSYNAYPGWHIRGMIREMMIFHARAFADPAERVRQARAFLEFLAHSAGDPNAVYPRLLKDEAELLARKRDAYLFHDHLEDENHPFYFHQFVERAAAHGLQYLAEASVEALFEEPRAEVQAALAPLSGDPVRREQYLDFLRCRRFRRTLLCHADVALDRTLAAGRLKGLHAVGLVAPQSPRPDIESLAVEEFRAPGGAAISTSNPLLKAVLAHLHERRPRAVPFAELEAVARASLARVPDAGAADLERVPRFLAEFLLQGCRTRLIELHAYRPAFAAVPGERPVASPLARLQARAGPHVANLLHSRVELPDFGRLVLPLLDAQHDRAALLEALAAAAAAGQVALHEDNHPVHDPQRIRQILDSSLDPILRQLAEAALLVA